ncbi:hypothetical protein ABGB17_11205 [Sphaerisporangium sp. B11E5]|uniref:hypothetical protein n=1 Tax=Sphaerisporangium sp. B11E5 TaxID=3153563 RepID=UPI00325D4306
MWSRLWTTTLVMVMVAGLVGAVTPAGALVEPSPSPSGTAEVQGPPDVGALRRSAVPPTCSSPGDHGWYLLGESDADFGDLYFANCLPNPMYGWRYPAKVWAQRTDAPDYRVCVPFGTATTEPVGFMRIPWNYPYPPEGEPYEYGEIWLHGYSNNHPTCTVPPDSGEPIPRPPCETCDPPPYTPPCPACLPPVVTVTGTIKTKVNAGAPERTFPGARYSLVYIDRDGNERPVLDGMDQIGRPSGGEVTGFLDEQGRYSLTFVYPQEYALMDGTRWEEGCTPTDVVFMLSHACADDDLRLVVYAENAAHDVKVMDKENREVQVAVTVPLGLYYDRTPAQETVVATSPEAYAYGGAHTFREIWPQGLPTSSARFLMTDEDDASYDPDTQEIELGRGLASDSAPEHEMAHLFVSLLYEQGWPPADGCEEHSFTVPSNPKCAFQEGTAEFLAQVAESRYTGSTVYRYWDMESCRFLGDEDYPAEDCRPGPAVEGRVAAALWDLHDATGEERDGFVDDVTVPLIDLLTVIAASEPLTVDELIEAWPDVRDDKRLLMFMNTLSTHGEPVDAKPGSEIRGDWMETPCPSCRGGSYLRSSSARLPSLQWSLPAIEAYGRYDLWVRLPAGDPGLDKSAVYEIERAHGFHVLRADQSAAVDGWLNLTPDGIVLDPVDAVHIVLRQEDQPLRSLAADAVILAPHLG